MIARDPDMCTTRQKIPRHTKDAEKPKTKRKRLLFFSNFILRSLTCFCSISTASMSILTHKGKAIDIQNDAAESQLNITRDIFVLDKARKKIKHTPERPPYIHLISLTNFSLSIIISRVIEINHGRKSTPKIQYIQQSIFN